MVSKTNISLIICLLFFLLNPAQVSACALTSATQPAKAAQHAHSSHAQHGEKECSKDCCKDKKSDKHDCSDNCCNKACQTTCHKLPITAPTYSYSDRDFGFEVEKRYAIYQEPFYSAGYQSIWQPPKIG